MLRPSRTTHTAPARTSAKGTSQPSALSLSVSQPTVRITSPSWTKVLSTSSPSLDNNATTDPPQLNTFTASTITSVRTASTATLSSPSKDQRSVTAKHMLLIVIATTVIVTMTFLACMLVVLRKFLPRIFDRLIAFHRAHVSSHPNSPRDSRLKQKQLQKHNIRVNGSGTASHTVCGTLSGEDSLKRGNHHPTNNNNKNNMTYTTDEMPWIAEEDDMAEMPRAANRLSTRRERIQGLGIKGLDLPDNTENDNALSRSKRRLSTRRSIISLITKTVESPLMGKHGSARASASRSNQVLSPGSSQVIPSTWKTSNTSCVAESSQEDITTYHTNVARFQAERAERAAELGLSSYDLCRTDSPGIDVLPAREEQTRKPSRLGPGRGLRAYWGGGSSSSEGKTARNGSEAQVTDPYWDDKADKDALKQWWDGLGT